MQPDDIFRHACGYPECFVNQVLSKQDWIAVWPLVLKPERGVRGTYIWSLYVEWRSGEGTHITRNLCASHHQAMSHLFQSSALVDRKEQEATDRWLVQVNSKLTRS